MLEKIAPTASAIIKGGCLLRGKATPHLARALTVGSVLFAPRPFARVTAISKGGVNHSGNSETMDGWDRFRGGIEFFASFIDPAPLADPVQSAPLLRRFQDFTLKRMQVAINLHVQAGNWSHAYHLDRRVRAYGQPGYIAVHSGLRPEPFYLGVAFVTLGLLLSVLLVRDPRGVVVADGRSLGEVTPAPIAPGSMLPFARAFS